MENEIKYTVAVFAQDQRIDDEYDFPQYFHIRSNDELEKFLHMMIIAHKKNVIVYQGEI